VHVRTRDTVEPYVTVDGSSVRELCHPRSVPVRNQSLAEASIPVGAATTAHYHRLTEELYYITTGAGLLRAGGDERPVRPGDCVLIPPGVVHKLVNTGATPLVVLCCCAPPYSHEDTFLTE
jgi:mannose-6-phosphate isomerase-like protein (cupin superfamily)